MTSLPAAPGDVLAVWTGQGPVQDAILIGELLAGKPAVANHVVIVTHRDQVGRWIGIQGQPGGVGPVDCTPYLSDARTRSNHDEPRPDDHDQLATFLASAARSLGLGYDWVGIAEDGLAALHVADLSGLIDSLWRWPGDRNLLPGHVVCSSLAAMLYELPSVGWAHPDLGTERTCEPADWWQWSQARGWDSQGAAADPHQLVAKSLYGRVSHADVAALDLQRRHSPDFRWTFRGPRTQDEVLCKCGSRP
jgi:hypothetical protein